MSQVFSVHARKGWNSIRKTFISRITICGTNKGKNKSSPLRPIISFKARVADESKHYFRANDVNRVNCVVCPIMALQRLTNIVRLVDPRNFFQTRLPSSLLVRGTRYWIRSTGILPFSFQKTKSCTDKKRNIINSGYILLNSNFDHSFIIRL